MATREEQREQSQHRIIEAGLELFSEQGYGSTSIRQIAQRADISLGLLYNYYSGKEDLLKAIIHDCRNSVIASFDETLDEDITDLDSFLMRVFSLVRARPTFWRLVYMIQFQQGMLTTVMEEIDQLLRLIYDRLEKYFQAKNDPEPQANARLLFASIAGISSQMLTESGYPDEMVVRQLIQTFERTE